MMNTNNKIVRWTISDQNLENQKVCLFSLKKSIESFSNNYPFFKKFICYNNISFQKIKFLENINVEFIDQKKYSKEINISPHDSFWKYIPPRIDINSYEIFIDNDVIFHKKIPELDLFLNDKKLLFSSSHKIFYGQFNFFIKNRIKLNTGFIGIHPFFDLKKNINEILNKCKIKKIKTHFDDQGLFCLILNNEKHIQIPLDVLNVCNSNCNFAKYKLGSSATHFAGINTKDFSYFKKFILSNFY